MSTLAFFCLRPAPAGLFLHKSQIANNEKIVDGRIKSRESNNKN